MDVVLWFQPHFLHLDNFRVSSLVPWESSNSLAWRLRPSIMSPHCPYSDLLLRSYCSPASLKSLYLNHFTQAPTLGGTSILIFIYSSSNQSFNNWVSLVLETKPMVYVIHTRLSQSMLDGGWLCFFHVSNSPESFLSVCLSFFFSPLLCTMQHDISKSLSSEPGCFIILSASKPHYHWKCQKLHTDC